MPPLAALRVFEAAGRYENFSRAAEELGMTQAAVSYQVRQLEEHLGEKVFEREAGRVNLSPAGRRIHAPVSEAFTSMRQLFADIDQQNSSTLAVSAPVSFGATWLSAKIGQFQVRYPDLALRLSLSNDVMDLTRGDFDAAIRIGKGQYEGLRADFLFRLHVTPLCTPEYAERLELREPKDLLRADLINGEDFMWTRYLCSAGLSELPEPPSSIMLENQAQEVSVAKEGAGVALLTPFYWRSDLVSGRLVQVCEHVFVSPITHWLVHPERRVGIRKIERFREWLAEELGHPDLGIPAEALQPVTPEELAAFPDLLESFRGEG